MAIWEKCVYNPFMILYILWIDTVYSRFSSPFLAVVGQCYSLKWHVAKHGSVLGLEGLVENTHSGILLCFFTSRLTTALSSVGALPGLPSP